MSTEYFLRQNEISSRSDIFSIARATIETAFYGNNVQKVTSLSEAYKLAKASPGTIALDMDVCRPKELGLADGTKVLLFNDGEVTGRASAARKIIGEPGVDTAALMGIIREAVYKTRYKKLYHSQVYIGLHPDFMVKANLLIPEGEENILYSWLLNFQHINEEYTKLYNRSVPFNEGDIYVFSDPTWYSPDYPMGLTCFDPKHNCAAILGMRYFGEHKKGTLTLAWSIANRNGFVACHGGQKRYNLGDRSFVAGVFGLSGSGKSTITHAHHNDRYNITVLHDDAFVISAGDASSIALEPAYFDKTQDYPIGSPDNVYLLSVQNNGATMDLNGKITLVAEDIRNGNGRAVKSRLWSPNREDKFAEAANAIFWLMKDPTMPPVLKIKDHMLASVMGLCLATIRTSAERLAEGVDPDALVFEPYANPFRAYPLAEDYAKFKHLFEIRSLDCYILNTGKFMGKKVTPEVTLGILEKIVDRAADFKPWHNFTDIEIMPVEGFEADLSDEKYKLLFKNNMLNRVNFIKSRETAKDGYDRLPAEAAAAIEKVISEI